MKQITQNTAYDLMVFLVLSSDHITGAAGKTLTITASKAGAAFASITPTVTERGIGWYHLALTSGHDDTLGDLAFHITAAGADPLDLSVQIVATGSSAPSAAAIRAEIDANSTALAAIDAAIAALPTAPSAAAVRAEIDANSTTLALIASALPTPLVIPGILAGVDCDWLPFLMTDSINHQPLPGINPGDFAIEASLDSASFAPLTATVHETGKGWYVIETIAAAALDGRHYALQIAAPGADTTNLSIPLTQILTGS